MCLKAESVRRRPRLRRRPCSLCGNAWSPGKLMSMAHLACSVGCLQLGKTSGGKGKVEGRCFLLMILSRFRRSVLLLYSSAQCPPMRNNVICGEEMKPQTSQSSEISSSSRRRNRHQHARYRGGGNRIGARSRPMSSGLMAYQFSASCRHRASRIVAADARR